jgi:hypothetical protein
MSAKKKSAEDSTSSIADGVNTVAHEEINIIWEDAHYSLSSGDTAVIPDSLYSYLATRGKVTAVTPNESEVIEVPLVEESEVTPEEGD